MCVYIYNDEARARTHTEINQVNKTRHTATIYQPNIIYRARAQASYFMFVLDSPQFDVDIRSWKSAIWIGPRRRRSGREPAGLPDRNIILFDVELIPGYICY